MELAPSSVGLAEEPAVMRFSRLQDLTTYLAVLCAILAVGTSGEVGPAMVALALAGAALSLPAPSFEPLLERLGRPWAIATLLLFVLLIVRIYAGAEIIESGVYFLLFLIVSLLFRRHRRAIQVHLLAFLLVVTAATFNTNLAFGIWLALYALCSIAGLMLLHLRRQVEEDEARLQERARGNTGPRLQRARGGTGPRLQAPAPTAAAVVRPRQEVVDARLATTPRLLGVASLLWASCLIGSAVIFTLFPRIGFGLFLGPRRAATPMAGFSERVELGTHGTIRDNPQVVMRVVLPPGEPPGPLRWRGTALDRYDDGVWHHSHYVARRARPVSARERLYRVGEAPGLPPETPATVIRRDLLRQEIYLEPLGTPVVFAADRPVALEIPRPKLGQRPAFEPRQGPLGEIHGYRMRPAGVRYFAYSQVAPLPSARVREAALVRDPRLQHYLQLPPGLAPRLEQLALEVTQGRQGLHDQVVAVREYLQTNYRYTVELTHEGRQEPVAEFLFTTRQGHCEYFASSLALLLRARGIHTRVVNGFAGGEWNEYGNYLAVRQGDAHSWTEVLYPGIGWVTVDATPPAAVPRAARRHSLRARLAQLVDALRLRWYRHVIEYDLGKQVALASRLRRTLGDGGPGQRAWVRAHRRHLLVLTTAALLALVGVVALRRRRRRHGERSPRRGPQHRATAIYREALALLARHGVTRGAPETPQELAHRLTASEAAWAPCLEELTHTYYAARYGRGAASLQRLEALLTALRRELRQHHRPSPAQQRLVSGPRREGT